MALQASPKPPFQKPGRLTLNAGYRAVPEIMAIVLQLKSAQRKQDLNDITHIIQLIKDQSGFKIRGHEIQQLGTIMKETTLAERAKNVQGLVQGFLHQSARDRLVVFFGIVFFGLRLHSVF